MIHMFPILINYKLHILSLVSINRTESIVPSIDNNKMRSIKMNFAKLILASAICLVSMSPAHANTQFKNSAPKKDIVDTAIAVGKFKTLVTAVKAAGLVEALKGPGPFTVFAPTDEAFAKLPPGTVEGLLKDIPALKNILLYHVVAGAKVKAAVAVTLKEAKMANGQKVKLEFDGANLFVNDSKVIMTDVETSNGVIHVIDTVLLP